MTSPDGSWTVRVETGSVQELHDLDPPRELVRTVRVMRPDFAAVVLGSSQHEEIIDAARARSEGLVVARRRSGGGAVLLVPQEHLWVDLLVPAGDPLWDDDIVRAAFWAGDAWSSALDSVGVGALRVHRGGLVSSRWSTLVCFAGLGPGEVHVGGRKLMGLSQRRSRDWIRIQSIVHTTWDPRRLVSALNLTEADRQECLEAVAKAAQEVSVSAEQLLDSLVDHLPG